ncbi:MAG: hypothetical protein ACYC61_26560 [Isosphaeraceae bacterium]
MEETPEPAFLAEIDDDATAASLRGPTFGVEFRRLADRWSESLTSSGSELVLARSHPGATDGDDPARVIHPVYQEVQAHGAARGASACLLLTGLSFAHHFSAAVTIAVDRDHAGTVLVDYDVADRCRSPVQVLAATYVVSLDSSALESADAGRIVWRVAGPPGGRLSLAAVAPCTLAMAEAGRTATRVQILAPIEAGTFTHRLRYGWRWTSVEGLTR